MATLHIDISVDGSILRNDKCRRFAWQMEDCKCYRDRKQEYKKAEERAESTSAEGKGAESRRSASEAICATINIDASKLIDELMQDQMALLDAPREDGALNVNDAAVYEINKYGWN